LIAWKGVQLLQMTCNNDKHPFVITRLVVAQLSEVKVSDWNFVQNRHALYFTQNANCFWYFSTRQSCSYQLLSHFGVTDLTTGEKLINLVHT